MKKILTLLSTFAITMSASATVVACGRQLETWKESYTTKKLNDLANYEVDLDNENSVWSNVKIAIQTQIETLVPDQEIKLDVDYQIETPEISEETGKPKFIGTVKVKAISTSKFLTGEFKILIKKDLTETLNNETLFPKEGFQEESEKVLGNILIEIEKWYPTAEKDVDYQIVEENDSWTINSINPLITFNFTFQLNKIIKVSITDLANYEVDLDNENSVWTNVKIAIQKQIEALVPDQEIKLGVDYEIESPEISEETGKPNFIGTVKVKAIATSKFLTGEFNVLIKKDLTEILNDNILFPKQGSEQVSEEVFSKIIAEIEKWYPTAEKDVDYKIEDINYNSNRPFFYGSKTIKSINPLLTFNFVFDLRKVDLSFLSVYRIDLDKETSVWSNVQDEIQKQIQRRIPSEEIKLGVDYEIETPDLDKQTEKPKFVGKVTATALPTSKFLTGEFKILIQKDLNAFMNNNVLFPKQGNNELGKEVFSKIVAEIKKWDPQAEEGVDYTITYGAGAWRLQSRHELIIFRDFLYRSTDVIDINRLDPAKIDNIDLIKSNLIFNIDDEELDINKIETVVDEEINKLSLTGKAQLGVDYIIEKTLYDQPFKTGRYLVSTITNSLLITGYFNLVIQKDLSEILSDDALFPKSGNKELGEEVKEKVIAEIKKWYPNANEKNDYSVLINGNWISIFARIGAPIYYELNGEKLIFKFFINTID